MKLKKLLPHINENQFVLVVITDHIEYQMTPSYIVTAAPQFLKKKVQKIYVYENQLYIEVY
jgi:hypothetical protein